MNRAIIAVLLVLSAVNVSADISEAAPNPVVADHAESTAAATPFEPSTFVLLLTGLIGLGVSRYRQKK